MLFQIILWKYFLDEVNTYISEKAMATHSTQESDMTEGLSTAQHTELDILKG